MNISQVAPKLWLGSVSPLILNAKHMRTQKTIGMIIFNKSTIKFDIQ